MQSSDSYFFWSFNFQFCSLTGGFRFVFFIWLCITFLVGNPDIILCLNLFSGVQFFIVSGQSDNSRLLSFVSVTNLDLVVFRKVEGISILFFNIFLVFPSIMLLHMSTITYLLYVCGSSGKQTWEFG